MHWIAEAQFQGLGLGYSHLLSALYELKDVLNTGNRRVNWKDRKVFRAEVKSRPGSRSVSRNFLAANPRSATQLATPADGPPGDPMRLTTTLHRAGGPYGASRDGGRNRARTCDPLLVRQVLCQLSYSPEAFSLPSRTMAAGTTTTYPATRRSGARVIEPFDSAK